MDLTVYNSLGGRARQPASRRGSVAAAAAPPPPSGASRLTCNRGSSVADCGSDDERDRPANQAAEVKTIDGGRRSNGNDEGKAESASLAGGGDERRQSVHGAESIVAEDGRRSGSDTRASSPTTLSWTEARVARNASPDSRLSPLPLPTRREVAEISRSARRPSSSSSSPLPSSSKVKDERERGANGVDDDRRRAFGSSLDCCGGVGYDSDYGEDDDEDWPGPRAATLECGSDDESPSADANARAIETRGISDARWYSAVTPIPDWPLTANERSARGSLLLAYKRHCLVKELQAAAGATSSSADAAVGGGGVVPGAAAARLARRRCNEGYRRHNAGVTASNQRCGGEARCNDRERPRGLESTFNFEKASKTDRRKSEGDGRFTVEQQRYRKALKVLSKAPPDKRQSTDRDSGSNTSEMIARLLLRESRARPWRDTPPLTSRRHGRYERFEIYYEDYLPQGENSEDLKPKQQQFVQNYRHGQAYKLAVSPDLGAQKRVNLQVTSIWENQFSLWMAEARQRGKAEQSGSGGGAGVA